MKTKRWTRMRPQVCLLLLIMACSASTAAGATVPGGFSESAVASGLASPTAMQFAPDGRLFVCEQGGRLRVIKDGILLAAPFVSLNVNAAGERGLLGVAFDPGFVSNRYVYVYYTATSPVLHNRISRFTANGDVAAAGSEVVLFDLDPLSSATNHNGGALAFGADGKLYAAVGENANRTNAQSMSTVLGKILRLNPNGSIPGDNPFYGSTSGNNRAIWALGLRNPFTFAFNPQGTEMFINDVGETSMEEINDGRAGANYGWPNTEGPTSDPRYVSPRSSYYHNDGACAISGGAFYSPLTTQFPGDYVNDYFFADFCGGWIKKLDPAAGNSVTGFATGITAPVDLKVSDDGSLYYLARGSGTATGVVMRISRAISAPTISNHPRSKTVAPGASVSFGVTVSGTPPLRYQWQRNMVDMAGATASSYTIASAAASDSGARFRVIVSNGSGNALSNEATLTVTGNQAPVGQITSPASGTVYSGGTVINYAGTGTDPEQGVLPASAFTWWIDFHHDTHVHPFMQPATGARSGSFTVPTTGHTAANVWYRIYLTVKDASGATQTSQRDVTPRVARLTLATNPPGLQVKLDDQPAATPLAVDSVVGIVRTIEAVTPQSVGGVVYTFTGWSDGGAVGHTFATPAANTNYTATFSTGGGGTPAGTYLSDMSWLSAVSGWGPVERDRSNGEAAAGDGRAIAIRGAAFTKGLGVHAPSDVRYTLPAGCSQFQALVGVDDETGGAGSVTFEVWAGGARLYASAGLNGGSAAATVNVALSGQTDLRLIVTNGGNGQISDHADWAMARVTCPAGGGARYVSDMTWTSAASGWGPVERDRSNGEAAAGDGRTITLRGATSAKGLGVHAPSDVRYTLPAGCSQFQAQVGVDDETGGAGSVTFEVWAGGVKLYTSPGLNGSSAVATVNVSLSGQRDLRLIVTDGGNGQGFDHADWAVARVTCP
jgi:glucose/arabinose dehydrogenase